MTIFIGDCRDVLRQMETASVHCIVTSPPYYLCRDYDHGDQVGREPTMDEYLSTMVSIFNEAKRVLHPSGLAFLNLGDTYVTRSNHKQFGLTPKNLAGLPWRVAFALQEHGWILRTDIIWSKKNCMPDSTQDRPTRQHEYIFMFARERFYYYDAEAIAEPVAQSTLDRISQPTFERQTGGPKDTRGNRSHRKAMENMRRKQDEVGSRRYTDFNARWEDSPVLTRNKRTVWEVSTRPYPGIHTAVFPEDLIRPCILAGTSEKGVCPECGNPWRRIVQKIRELDTRAGARALRGAGADRGEKNGAANREGREFLQIVDSQTVGWEPTCECGHEPVPAVVLDPFAGSGTTLQCAMRHGRDAWGIEINPDYESLITDRLATLQLPLFTEAS